MAYYDLVWYCNAGDQATTGHYAVAKWAAGATIAAGALRRQLAVPTVGNERVFAAIVGGTTGGAEPAWVLTRGAKTTDNTVTWQEVTGASAVNGDITNTPNWTQAKAIGTPTLGAIIKRGNNASYWIASTAGTMGASEPAWPNDTAGTTQVDGTTTWTCLGVVGNFTGGQAPHARLANACATNWFAVGNTVYVGDNHAESQASLIKIDPAAALGSIGKIICHNHSGSYPPTSANLATTATVSTTANVAIYIGFSNVGPLYFRGLTFAAVVGTTGGSSINIGFSSSGDDWLYFDNCSFWLASTTGIGGINLTGAGVNGVIVFNNTTVKFAAAAGQSITPFGVVFIWQNTAPALAPGSTIPNVLLNGQYALFNAVLEALDLSLFTGTLVGNSGGGAYPYGSVLVKDCKLSASLVASAPGMNSGIVVQFVRSDSVATGYKSSRYTYEGTETTETAITRVGGATDPTSQAQSRKIVTSANSQWLRPFKAEPYAIWNPTTGANVTVTVYGTINAGALPNNDDIWLEVEYLGDPASALGTIVNTTKANLLAANAAVASDSSSWNLNLGFDPTSITNTTLSNNNLTATHSTTTSGAGARVATSANSGKFYFEFKMVVDNGSSDCVGLLSPGGTYTDFSTGVNPAIAVNRASGNIFTSGVSTGVAVGVFAANDVAGIAIDFGAGLYWIRRNAGNWNNSGTANPATGTGGLSFAAGIALLPAVAFIGSGQTIGDQFVANFGATSYTSAAPSGFSNWNFYSPFKLVATLSSPQPGLAGYLEVRVRAAKPSSTYYIDPKITLS